MERIDYGKNSVGKSMQVGKYSVTLQSIKPFVQWVDDYDDFLRLSKTDKRILYLRWKWGFTSNDANEGLETTRRMLVERYKLLLDNPAEDVRWMANNIIEFENYCYKTMCEIGLVEHKTEEQKQVEKIVEDIFVK